MDLEQNIEKLGLNKNEALVYLNTLKLGLSKASEIAQKSNINREASYYTLKLLREKGFISEVIKSGVRYYSAVQPKRILQIIEEEKQTKTEAIKEIIPELESLQKIAITKPRVEFYEGVEGFKTIVSKLIENKNQEICCYVPEKILHFMPTFHPQFRRKRRENKINLKLITEKTKFMQELEEKDKEELRETRFNNKIMKNMDSAFYILPNGIIIIKANEKEQIGIYIEEEGTAKIQENIFKKIWDLSQKY